MLFLCNIFFVIIKVSEQCSFYFAYDSLFNAKYNGLLDVVKAPGSALAGVLVPIIVERMGANQTKKNKKTQRATAKNSIRFAVLWV